MGPITLNVTGARIAQIALGGAAVYGGYKLASSVVRNAYREDLLGDPTRIVEIDDKTMIYQTREAQGGKLTNFMMGAGALTAAVGGVLALRGLGATGMRGVLATGGGAALFALGLGGIAGATSTAAQFQGSDFEPIR